MGDKNNKIFHCIKNNNLRQTKLLLDAGCDVNVKDTSGRTPLMTSLVHVHDADARSRLVQLLIQAGADVNAIDNKKKTALTYACSLNQVEIVRRLLRQPGLDPNIKDTDGATALMHAVGLGHYNVTKVMMDYNRSESVTIDIHVQDDNGHTALDHAKDSKDKSNSKRQRSSSESDKIVHLFESYNESVRSLESSPKKVSKPTEGIELVDMTHIKAGKKNKSGVPIKQSHAQSQIKHEKETNETEKESSLDSNLSIRQWSSELKQEHDESGRMSTLRSASSSTLGRPASRLGTGKGSSTLDKASPTKLSPSKGPSSSTKSPNHLSVEKLSSSDDEDGEISLQSLSELVGTVRQYAQEIREIYAPIQKEEEERTKRRNEKNERRKQKALQKQASVKSDTHLAPPFQREVTVEIHKIEDGSKKSNRGRPQGPSHSRSHEPNTGQPLASLHVENEQLSSTWPRGRQRPRSRDRYRNDMHVHAREMDGGTNPNLHGSTSSIASAPNPGTYRSTRPRIPSDWSEDNGLQQEREILNKAFSKLVMSKEDPLLTTINQKKKSFKLQEQLKSSRQSVIQLGKSHQQGKKAEVPSISVIPPPGGELGHGLVTSKQSGRPLYGNSVLPSEETEFCGAVGGSSRMSESRGKGGRGSNKSGLRRRKSVDQGMGQQVFLEKY